MVLPGNGSPASGGPPPNLRFPRRARLLKSQEFKNVFSGGRSYVGRAMVMWTLTGGEAGPRLGVVASRKIGGAVSRNRAKRLLRECFRLTRNELRADVDMVLVARAPLPGMRLPAAREEYLRLAGRAGVWKEAKSSEQT